ncbi:MAG: hypothetical protein ACOC8E_06605, partial [Planctomycetota bacterium]
MNAIADVVTHPLVWPIAAAVLAGLLATVLSRWSAFVCKVLALAASICVLVGGITLAGAGALSERWVWVEGLTENVSLV